MTLNDIWDGFLTAACHFVKVLPFALRSCSDAYFLGFTQGGSDADIVLADAYIKGLSDGIDWNAGYAAVQKDAEEEPYDWSSEGRGGLVSWKSLNYIPVEDFDYLGFGPMTRSISRTLEYSYNDFVIAQMARSLNKTGDAEKYESRSGNWQNLFREDQTSYLNGNDTGFKGFFQPKYLNGTWGFQVSHLTKRHITANAPLTNPGPSGLLQHRHQRKGLLTNQQRSRNIRIQHLGIPIVSPSILIPPSISPYLTIKASSPTTWQP